jgi:hypothetical protein
MFMNKLIGMILQASPAFFITMTFTPVQHHTEYLSRSKDHLQLPVPKP